MSKINHSPLPWNASEYESDYAKPEAVSRVAIESNDMMTIAVLVGDVVDRRASQTANAGLIVRAVNAYESNQQLIKQLTEALEATKSTLKGLRELSESQAAVQYKDYADYAVRQIDAALAAVKQQEQK